MDNSVMLTAIGIFVATCVAAGIFSHRAILRLRRALAYQAKQTADARAEVDLLRRTLHLTESVLFRRDAELVAHDTAIRNLQRKAAVAEAGELASDVEVTRLEGLNAELNAVARTLRKDLAGSRAEGVRLFAQWLGGIPEVKNAGQSHWQVVIDTANRFAAQLETSEEVAPR